MTKNQTETPEETPMEALDLSVLSELDFGPSWAEKGFEEKSSKKTHDPKMRTKHAGGGGMGKFNRRSPSRKAQFRGDSNNRSEGGRKTFNRDKNRDWNPTQRDTFEPVVDINIYPQDQMFEALIKRLRSTARTYQLFEIAQLILAKPERYVVVVQNKKKDEIPRPLYFTVPDHLPFDSEDAAINHFLTHHLDPFFSIEQIEVEPPRGNFQMVNRCSITGELLGPPNYHRYQEFLQRHYASRISNMSFDHFASKVEPVKEQESIDAWVESMKKGVRYTLREPRPGEPESFESLEAVRSFLLQNRKAEIIGSDTSVRFAGRDVAHLPKGSIRRSIETYIANQLRFPLDTANNIRGRLRRHHFTVYKRGSKGIAYVCSVKRKFRNNKTIFTASIQTVIDFIESHPNILASELPEKILGIDVKKQDPVKLEAAREDVSVEESGTGDESSNEVVSEESKEPSNTSEGADTAASDPAELPHLNPQTELSEDELKRLNQLILDLRWLVTEGYVTEYGDGSLFAQPPMPEPTAKKPLEQPDPSSEPG